MTVVAKIAILFDLISFNKNPLEGYYLLLWVTNLVTKFFANPSNPVSNSLLTSLVTLLVTIPKIYPCESLLILNDALSSGRYKHS